MQNNGKAARRALRSALESWFWRDEPEPEEAEPFEVAERPAASVRTELSATVFSGDAQSWVRYLQTPRALRYEREPVVHVHLHRELRAIAFEPEGEASTWLASILERGFRHLRKRLEAKPNVLRVVEDMMFEVAAGRRASMRLVLSEMVPGDGTREGRSYDADGDITLVLNAALARTTRSALEQQPTASESEKLGIAWPLVSRVLLSLAYPALPRDLFVTRIDLHSRLDYVTLNVLFDGHKGGTLTPTNAGNTYLRRLSETTGIPVKDLQERNPYLRSLNKLSFMLRAQPYGRYAEDARVVAREYLDPLYLRLSLSGAMPEPLPTMLPMAFTRKSRKIRTPDPELGRYGILDMEDLEAWRAVSDPFQDLGFTLLKQLGIGEFGRVYEALNENNRSFPLRVALKVDRIVGKKKKAILEAEEAMKVGRSLAGSPHLIRLYDTGKLSGQRFTYHVLQLIDGDTLDNLLGVTGREHASVHRPDRARATELDAREEFERAFNSGGSELWRRQRVAAPFSQALSPAMVLDLVTSVLLWLEEVHEVGYANNDLKNGNLMMSRRGQLKGIDLDSYTRIHSPKDKMTDFMFLAVSMILLLFNAPVSDRGRHINWEELVESEERLRQGLAERWPLGDVSRQSQGRVSQPELTDVFVDLVQRSRRLHYVKQPQLFSKDIVRLLDLKRRLLWEELVLD